MSAGASLRAGTGRRDASPFLVLGVAGLIPFVAGTAALWSLPAAFEPYLLQWLLGYAMVILAFVGALHWGVAMQAEESTPASTWIAAVWSVIPALVAWLALAFETAVALRILAGMFLLQLAMDRWLTRNFTTPDWYLRLRVGLTLVAAASLLVASYAGSVHAL